MSKTRAIIIEDEYPAARLLNNMIRELRPGWEVVMLPGSIEESVEWFAANPHPDILFLDIQLTDGLSFHFIEQAHPQCMIVFTTAYDEYAVRAFAVNSIDYLLKPIHKERLEETLQRCERLSASAAATEARLHDLEALLRSFTTKQEKQYRTRFLISGTKRFYTIQVADIAYFYSEEKLTFAVTQDGKAHIVDFPLNKLEEQLDGRTFFRANRQFILSAGCIKSIEPYFHGKVTLKVSPPFNGTIIISKEKISPLKMWLNS